MLYWIWNKIQMWLPFWLLVKIYSGKKGLPANIKLRSGRNLRAIMINTEYGVLFTSEKYDVARLSKLKKTSEELMQAKNLVDREINGLGFEVKEQLFNGDEDIHN